MSTSSSSETAIATTTQSSTPLSLISDAINRGVDVDTMNKLMDLQERYERNQALKAYAAAMAACEKEMGPIIKDRENTHTRSRYATLDAVNTVIKPVYAKHGFSVSFNETITQSQDMVTVTAKIRHAAGHCEEFQTSIPMDGAGMKGGTNKTGTQAKGSTLSYARRYLLLMIFNIAVADEDTDGNAPQLIDQEGIAAIEQLIATCEKVGNPVDRRKFLTAMHVHESRDIDSMLAKNVMVAIRLLNRKISEKVEPVAAS